MKLTFISTLAITLWCNTAIPATAQAEKSAPAKKQTSTGSTQDFVFPSTSIGTVYNGIVKDDWRAILELQPVMAAMGHVSLKLAPGKVSCLRYNTRILKSPELIDKFSADLLDGIWIDFMTMEDNEKSMSDKFVARSGRFPHLKFLLIERSDASDVGLLQLPRMPELRIVCGAMSGVTGKFLDHADRFPALMSLSLYNCKLDSPSLKNLPQLTHLQDLDVHHTGLKPIAMQFVGKCENLEVLKISENPALDDSCMVHLNGLKKLKRLEMTEVGVTMKGLLSLRPISSNITALRLSSSLAQNRTELSKLFPHCRFEFLGRAKQVDSATGSYYAPLR